MLTSKRQKCKYTHRVFSFQVAFPFIIVIIHTCAYAHTQKHIYSYIYIVWNTGMCVCVCVCRVLTRISKMPFQNSNSKISASPDLASNLLQILIFKLHLIALLCQKMQFTLQLCPKRLFVSIFYQPQKFKIENSLRNVCLSKKEV